jgi:hypothetical protein
MQYKQWKRGNRNSSACINDVLLTIALTSDECYGQGGKLQCIRSSHIFTETFVDSLTTISFLAAVDRCWGVWVVRVYLDWESGEVVKASTTSRDQSRHIFLSTSSPTPLQFYSLGSNDRPRYCPVEIPCMEHAHSIPQWLLCWQRLPGRERCDSHTIVDMHRVPVFSIPHQRSRSARDGQLPVSSLLRPESATERLQV